MGYKTQKMTFEEAQVRAADYEYALVYEMGDILLARTDSLPQIHWDECMEARFFSEDRELHLYERDGQMEAVEVSDADEKEYVEKRYVLGASFKGVGRFLRVREYIQYDEDGQACVALTRLCGIEQEV